MGNLINYVTLRYAGWYKIEKVRQTIYIDNEVYFFLHNYAKDKNLKTISQTINVLVPEYRRFRTIAMKLQDEITKKQEGNKIEKIKSFKK